MKRNLITRTVGSLLILRQNTEAPSDSEWRDCMKQLDALLRVRGGQGVRVFVYTDGGAPTVAQRTLLQRAVEKTPVRTAVVTDDVKARITSSTVALGNRNHRSFSVAELSNAFAHLALSPAERPKIEEELRTLSLLLVTP